MNETVGRARSTKKVHHGRFAAHKCKFGIPRGDIGADGYEEVLKNNEPTGYRPEKYADLAPFSYNNI